MIWFTFPFQKWWGCYINSGWGQAGVPGEDRTPKVTRGKKPRTQWEDEGSGENREPPQRNTTDATLHKCSCHIRLLSKGKPLKKPEIRGTGQCFSKWVPLTTCMSISQALVKNTDSKPKKKKKKIHTDSWAPPQISGSRISGNRTLKFAFLTTTCILKFKNHHHGVLNQRRPQSPASCSCLQAGFPTILQVTSSQSHQMALSGTVPNNLISVGRWATWHPTGYSHGYFFLENVKEARKMPSSKLISLRCMLGVDPARPLQTNNRIKATILETNMRKYNKQYQNLNMSSNISNAASAFRKQEQYN